MLDAHGRVLYLGRSSDLRSRVRSYWGDLRDRPHLRRMVKRVARVEFEVCQSEHAAALRERELLEAATPYYNRVVGTESQVWIRLCSDPSAPSLTAVHECTEAPHVTNFGPYLGWAAASEATRGLSRLFPIELASIAPDTAMRELAVSRGVTPAGLETLVRQIRSVLSGEPAAVSDCVRRLTAVREQNAANLMFEAAAEVHGQIDAITWITQDRPA
jgi:excinuclease ABC subunit C